MAATSTWRKRRKHDDTGVWRSLRCAQRLSGCKTSTLKRVLKAVEPFCGTIKKNDDKLFQDTDAVVLQLYGCVGCNQFVFPPQNTMVKCPKCQHPRFNQKKKPNQVLLFCLLFFVLCLLCYSLTNFFVFVCLFAGVLVLPAQGAADNTHCERTIPAFTTTRNETKKKTWFTNRCL